MVERTATGIEGFDNLIQGGIPKGFNVLLAGGPGTGKSIFSMQFLVEGATKFNENGIYISFEQRIGHIREQGRQFGWDIESLEREKKITIISIPVKKINYKLIEIIKETIFRKNIKRMVIDSLSTLFINIPLIDETENSNTSNHLYPSSLAGEFYLNRFLYNFLEQLREIEDCTKILIAEVAKESDSGEIILGEYACDAVIRINFDSLGGGISRNLLIRKMRLTKNDEDIHPFEISDKGVIIHSIS
jgi:KaiC/GvpD/RAD55 family RecA-like ATPase